MESRQRGSAFFYSRDPVKSLKAWLVIIVGLGVSATPTIAGPYDAAGQKAAAYLIANMIPADQTWGTDPSLKYLNASEVAISLHAWDRRSFEYYAALTWMSNHDPINADYTSRRVLSLAPNGESVLQDLNFLGSIQSLNLPAPGNSGVGLNTGQQGSPLDTALALQAFNQAGVTTNVTAATGFLKSTQLAGADSGWAIGQETASDPITTAQVILGLIPYRSGDATLATPIANGLAALNAKVTIASSVQLQALAALANWRSSPNSSFATGLLGNLVATQAGDGSWGENVEATALALRALAAGAARDSATSDALVQINDPNLRTAINVALSRNALDNLNQGELAQLVTLNISGQGITDLTGLQDATSLTNLDASNNDITNWAPVDALPQKPTENRTGNPGYPAASDNSSDVPLPPWAYGALALLLMGISQRRLSSARPKATQGGVRS